MDIEYLPELDTSLYSSSNASKINSSLISSKSFLEIILNQIKSCQNDILTKNLNIKNIKRYLLNLRNNLQNFENDKKINEKYLVEEIRVKKIELQNKLYKKSKDHYNIFRHYNSIDDINFHKNNKNEKINYFNEKEQLKLLSFKIEYQIQQIDFEFKKKINTILNLKIARLYQEEDLELDIQNKKLKSKSINILKKNLEHNKKKLILQIRTNLNNNLKIKKIQEKIKELKHNISNNNKIYNTYHLTNNALIREENNNKIKEKKFEDEDENNKRNSKYKYSPICSKCGNLKIDFEEISEKIHNKVMRSLSNKIVKSKNAQIVNNNLNLNIKLNLNFNNIKIINENINGDKSKANLIT